MSDRTTKTFKRPKVHRRNADGTYSDQLAVPSSSHHENGNEYRRKIPAGSVLNRTEQSEISNEELHGKPRNVAMNLGLPNRWTYCPKYGNVIGELFFPMKTPLSEGYDDLLETQYRFHPQDVFKIPYEGAKPNAKIKLWINLTNTERYYGKGMVAANDCKYEWIRLKGHGQCPEKDECEKFIRIVNDFKVQHPNDLVAVHCTHGFNRTGFLIVAYLIQTENYDVETATTIFAAARPNGIYKDDYIAELCKQFEFNYNPEDPLPFETPGRPAWEDGPDPSINYDKFITSVPEGFAVKNSVPLFMDGQAPGCVYVEDSEVRSYVQGKVKAFMTPFAKKPLKNEFPGSQPVSMDQNNINLLASHPYMVSWKADGMRYLVLINGFGEVYAFDRDNNPFFLPIRFPRPNNLDLHVEDTLVDAEVIMQRLPNGSVKPRMLIYDIITYEKVEYGRKEFNKRMDAIQNFLVESRLRADAKGIFCRKSEPLSVARKDFWEVQQTYKCFSDTFTQNMGHHVDGLIYQPVSEPYTPGRFNLLLKWKPIEEASIDFKLQIIKRSVPGEPIRYIGELHVLGLPNQPFARMAATRSLLPFDGKIIECNYVNGEWRFMRERTDKSHPNAFSTATSVVSTIKNPLSKEFLVSFIRDFGYYAGRPIHVPPPPPVERRRQQSTQMHSRVL